MMLDAGTFPHAATALIAKRLLGQHSPTEIAEAITVLIDVLDIIGGDPDAEDDDPDEVQGDERDCAWIEWTTMRGSQKRGPNVIAGHEDAEDGDPAEDDDPGGCEHDGREPEAGC
jgi:hypothetical protein